MRRSLLLTIAMAVSLNVHGRDTAAPNEARTATERGIPAAQPPSRAPAAPQPRGTATAPASSTTVAPAPGPMPMLRMPPPAMQAPAPAAAPSRAVPAPLGAGAGAPAKPPVSIATPAHVVVGAAGAVPTLPASIDTGALTATGLGDKPVPQFPVSIATPGLHVSGTSP